MGFYTRIASGLAAMAVVAAASADLVSASAPVADLSQAANSTLFFLNNASVVKVTSSLTGNKAEIYFNGYRTQFGQTFSAPKNWSNIHVATMTLRNLESHDVKFNFIVMVQPDLKDYTGSFNGGFVLPANSTKKFVFYVNPPDMSAIGLDTLPPFFSDPYTIVKDGTRKQKSMYVYQWRLSLQDQLPADVEMSDYKVAQLDTSLQDICDKYGQFTGRTWAGKVTSDSDLPALKAQEDQQLLADPGVNEVLGSNTLPGVSANGRWGVATRPNGAKYLVSPVGKMFWSLGLNAVHYMQSTQVENRGYMFENLPANSGFYAQFFDQQQTPTGQRQTYSFNRQNLALKYGTSDFEAAWTQTVRRRMRSWGFNTLGMQSDPSLMTGFMPFTLIADTDTFPIRLKTNFVEWESLPDPYDFRFEGYTRDRIAARWAPYRNFAALMGIFVDNEMSWGTDKTDQEHYNVAFGALSANYNQPAKVAFLDQLKGKYGSIAALNQAWDTHFLDWDTLRACRSFAPSRMSPEMTQDMKDFTVNFAKTYYGKVRSAIDTLGVKALYLGSRFATFNSEVIQGAAPYVDVLSFNVYGYPQNINWDQFTTMPKPVLLSEFCFSVLDRGSFGGIYEASTFSERSQLITDYLTHALSNPNIVGAHWYTYVDQPITGRYSDGENKGMGVVDVTDTPYPETVATFRNVAENMYSFRG